MTNILFSIIMPAYNAEKYIKFAIESVIKQNYKNWELIIVENGSTDNTTEKCKQYLYDERISLYHSAKGVSRARNYGINKAKGKYVLFLDADDMLEDTALQIYNSNLDDYVDLISTRFSVKKRYSNNISVFKNDTKEKYLIQVLDNPTQRCTVTRSLFDRKKVLQNDIFFDETLSHGEDSVFLVQYILVAKKILDIDAPTYLVGNNPSSAVRQYDKDLSKEYIASIKVIENLLKNKNAAVHEALYTYILVQLLIIFVHNTFSSKTTLNRQIVNGKEILNSVVFKNAAKKIKLKNVTGPHKVVFYFIKNKNMIMLALISKIRILQNSRKK